MSLLGSWNCGKMMYNETNFTKTEFWILVGKLHLGIQKYCFCLWLFESMDAKPLDRKGYYICLKKKSSTVLAGLDQWTENLLMD